MITYMNKILDKTRHSNKSLQEVQETVGWVVKEHVDALVKYIFPISEIRPNKSEPDSGAEDTVTALAEASRTTYVHGRWVYADNVCDVQYQIVESFLPASGDYSDYSIWVSTTKDAVPAVELAHKNPAYAITAGLTYTTQLICVLSFFMDLNLPHELNYSDFCSHELNRDRFVQKVAKMNANVLHLCFHHGVNPDKLHPRQTIRNLLHLLNSENYNPQRLGLYRIETNQLNSMEESLRSDLNISVSDEDEDEENDFIGEWEKVHSVSCEDTQIPSRGLSATTAVQYNTLFRQNTHPPHAHATASATGGLVSSAMGAVTSWWKALGK
uniref:Beclin 1-associated autophagy-related key regulator n=1 Tax=Strigamia maritima TaxID=126957 RepID=T1JJT5_STRMM